jgi:thiol-disulfide isomerase/thioredoxin
MIKLSRKVRKEVSEWLIFLGILFLIYITGGHVVLQRMILQTGIFNPNTSQPIALGEASYELKLQDLSGKVYSLSDFKGKTIFFNFWATWCPPCLAEMPDIEQLYQKVDKDKVIFVMLTVDEDPAKVEAFLAKNNYSFPVYFLASALPEVYYHNSIPRTYVISPKGKIITKHIGMTNYNTSSFKSFLER